jgi:predicted branched-subunit amino acid permease
VATWPAYTIAFQECQAAIGMAFGVVGRTAGLSVLEVTLMSLVLYARSAQFIAVGLIASGAPALATIATVALINIRHLF